jgi:glycosyltransferase involved in cell wall biosynthesis
LSLVGIVYSYFIYPCILLVLNKIRPSFILATDIDGDQADIPKLSLIITAHNEQARIKEKLENSLLVEYPRGCLEIIVASDCSTDETDSIVLSYADKGVRLVRANEHNGKEYAQKLAIDASSGDILIFSDAGTKIPELALELIAEKFTDSRVGAVSSEDRFLTDDGEVVGEGAYVRYEMWLRGLETKTGGLVGLSGSFFAARRAVCTENWDTQSDSDFNTALNCGRLGLVAISSDDVLGFYKDVKNPEQEYHRKVRTVLRGITGLARQCSVLNPFELGLFSFKVLSHKFMRWAVPWFMLLALVSNVFLLDQGLVYQLIFACQLAAYSVVALAWKIEIFRDNTLIKLGFFFVQVNIAIADATLRFFRGQRMVVWKPSER